MSDKKNIQEKTIRSETTKVFLIIFAILIAIGSFTVFTTHKSSQIFINIHGYFKSYDSAERLKQESLEIIAIFYLLSTNQENEVLSEEIHQYNIHVGVFNELIDEIRSSIKKDPHLANHPTLNKQLDETELLFKKLNESCKQTMLAVMSKNKTASNSGLSSIQSDIAQFKKNVDGIEKAFTDRIEISENDAKSFFNLTTILGLILTTIGILITLAQIYYLMKFLSATLLPISNLLHNLRQAVFSIDKSTKVIAPFSRYTNTVFDGSILNKEFLSIFSYDSTSKEEIVSKIKFVMKAVFGETEAQWVMAEYYLPKQLAIKGEKGKKILRLSYTPLFDKNKKVQNIMIVAEDVTEIVNLREASSKKESELAIIKAFMDMQRSEIIPFLADCSEKISVCSELIEKIQYDPAARDEFPRILHTLKGNSRMYFLTTLSEKVHEIEGYFVDFTGSLESGENPTDKNLISMKELLSDLKQTMKNYDHIADKLLGDAQKENLDTGHDQSFYAVCRNMTHMAQRFAKSLNKEVHIKVLGDDFQLDKNRIQALKDALVHMIRNSIDHGIEDRSVREILGKKSTAEIIIECKDNGQNFNISIRDDGRGIDVDKIISKAISSGLVNPRETENFTEEDKLNLIFLPKLSTKDEASMISGRGIGMDAVKKFINNIGGSIKVQSKAKVGTEFTLIVPRSEDYPAI